MRTSDISTSRELKLALLKALGISTRHVTDVELDLSDEVALVNVTVAVPACVNGLITHELESYQLVKSPAGDSTATRWDGLGQPLPHPRRPPMADAKAPQASASAAGTQEGCAGCVEFRYIDIAEPQRVCGCNFSMASRVRCPNSPAAARSHALQPGASAAEDSPRSDE